MNFSKCTINGKKYGKYLVVLLRGNPWCIPPVLGDLPEEEADRTAEVSLSHSLNADESNDEEGTVVKDSGTMLHPVSVAILKYTPKGLTQLASG